MTGWNHPDTARWYRTFEETHGRYRLANAALVRHAALQPGQRVLDLAAGTGGTTSALLPRLGAQGRVDCVEVAAAMRHAGTQRIGPDPRVRWLSRLAQAQGPYDRIVCGAALWQMPELPQLLRRLAHRLAPGGAMCFNVPAAYLGRPDRAGGGSDPWLTALPGALEATAVTADRAKTAVAITLPRPRQLSHWLRQAGLQPLAWQHSQRLTQAAWRDWLKIPVLTQQWWPGLSAQARAERIDAACRGLDPHSWRHERWLGWTAWRPDFQTTTLPDATPLLADGKALQQRATRDGCLLLRQGLPPPELKTLRAIVTDAARAEHLLDGRGQWIGGHLAAMHESPAWLRLQRHVAAALQTLARHPALLALLRRVFDAEPEHGHGSICRLAPPEWQVCATPPHRDADYMPHKPGLWIAWLPLHDCTVDQGVLAMAPGSHLAPGLARDDPSGPWAASALRLGDVLLFSAQTLHRACPNRQWQRPRLSVDLRFLPQA